MGSDDCMAIVHEVDVGSDDCMAIVHEVDMWEVMIVWLLYMRYICGKW